MNLPISIQLLDTELRNTYHLTRITNDKSLLLSMPGEIGDIIRHCHMDGVPPILSDSPTPVFGKDDRDLLAAIAFIEELESKARKGEILL